MLTKLRNEQLALLQKPADTPELNNFYTQVIADVKAEKIDKLGAYTLFGDLFEDCPE